MLSVRGWSTVEGDEVLRTFRHDFRVRWLMFVLYGAAPVIVFAFFLLNPSSPDIFTPPWAFIWLFPVILYLIVFAAARMDLNARKFWTALRPRLVALRYDRRGGVTAVFDNQLAAVSPLGIRFSLFFGDDLRVLPPTPEKVYAWSWRSQKVRGRASESKGEGSIPAELRRIREAVGGAPPGAMLSAQELMLTEHPTHLPEWPEVRYCISMTVRIPKSDRVPQRILNEIDDIARFLTECTSVMAQGPETAPAPSRATL